jgi:hypothetical protein
VHDPDVASDAAGIARRTAGEGRPQSTIENRQSKIPGFASIGACPP